MSTYSKTDQANTLQEAFFSKLGELGEGLPHELQAKMATSASRPALSEASGITDLGVLDQLMKLRIGSITVAALSLIPLVEVAYAKGSINAKERSALLHAAEKEGLTKEKPAYPLLEWWLENRPDSRLFEVWKDCAETIAGWLSPETRALLRDNIFIRARALALASAQHHRIGGVSGEAWHILLEVDDAFSAKSPLPR